MDRTITSDIVVADSHCHRKAFLMLCGGGVSRPHEYEQVIVRRAAATRLSFGRRWISRKSPWWRRRSM